jgi:hypothetical protein
MVLVLKDLRGVLLVHATLLTCGFYVIRRCWLYDSTLCTYRLCYYYSVFHFGTTFRSFRYLSLVFRFWCFHSYDSSFCISLLYVILTDIVLFIPSMDLLFLLLDRTLFPLTLFIFLMFFVPDLTMQHMSTGQITDHDCRIIFDTDFCYIQDHCSGHLVGTDPHRRDSQRLWELNWLHLPSVVPCSFVSSAFVPSSMSLFAQ